MHINVHKHLKDQMKDVAVMTVQSVRRKLNAEERLFCFEIFGFDFIIDKAFKVWLIEINTNPCLEESSRLLGMILPRMVDDALRLTVDQVLPRKRAIMQDISPYKVTGYSNTENMWEYLTQIGAGKFLTNNYKTAMTNILKMQNKNKSEAVKLESPEKLCKES